MSTVLAPSGSFTCFTIPQFRHGQRGDMDGMPYACVCVWAFGSCFLSSSGGGWYLPCLPGFPSFLLQLFPFLCTWDGFYMRPSTAPVFCTKAFKWHLHLLGWCVCGICFFACANDWIWKRSRKYSRARFTFFYLPQYHTLLTYDSLHTKTASVTTEEQEKDGVSNGNMGRNTWWYYSASK